MHTEHNLRSLGRLHTQSSWKEHIKEKQKNEKKKKKELAHQLPA